MKSQIPEIGNYTELTEEVKDKIRALVTEAGGARLVAKKCRVSYDTYHNVLRGKSSDFALLQKMIDKAKELISAVEKSTITI